MFCGDVRAGRKPGSEAVQLTMAGSTDRNYYDVLGVAKGASADEIRRAYRKLARELHPDVNKSPDAAKKFGEVQKAYDIVSDDEKRKAYDQFGAAAFETGWTPPGRGRPNGAGRGGTYSWTNVGEAGGQGAPMDMDQEDMADIFEAMFGGGGGGMGGANAGRAGRETPPKGRAPRTGPRRGRAESEPIARDLEIPFSLMASGGSQALRMDDGMGGTRTIEVSIPRGVEEGAQIRVKNAAGTRDLLLTIKVAPHLKFRRGTSESDASGKGLDLWIDLPLSIAQATLGGPVPVPTLEGPVDLTIPAGTDSGRRLRLKAKGLTDASGNRGDLYVQTRIVVPRQPLTPEEREVLTRISQGSTEALPR